MKLFRNLKHKLLYEGKLKKYLFYAFGEIFIVTIGILFALHINNWNQNQISKKSEIKILTELKNDFEANFHEINYLKSRIIELNRNSNIINLLENEIPLENQTSQLNRMGGFMGFLGGYGGIFNSANTSYKYLESTGINSFNNDSLRIAITKMFEEYFKNIHIREKQYSDFYTYEYEPFVTKNFEFTYDMSGMAIITGVNLNSKTDYRIFKNILIKKATYEKFRIERLNETLDKLEELIVDLKVEIKYLKK